MRTDRTGPGWLSTPSTLLPYAASPAAPCLQVERYQGLNDRLVQMQEENRQLYNTVQARALQAGGVQGCPA